jgi:hypothetical protein
MATRKNPKTWTPDERAAWEAHLDETIQTLYDLVEKGRAELAEREARRVADKPGQA